MQTGVFYVKLKDEISEDEQGESLSGRVEHLQKVFEKDVPYPVLAVHFRAENKLKQTFYHMPTKAGDMRWFSSEYFRFHHE